MKKTLPLCLLLVNIAFTNSITKNTSTQTGYFSNILGIHKDSNHYARLGISLWDSTEIRRNKHQSNFEQLFILDGNAWGKLNPQLSFKSHFRISTEFTNIETESHHYDPKQGLPYNKQSNTKKTWDVFNARTDYTLPYLTLSAGVDYLNFSPTKRNSLVWSGNSNRYRPWNNNSDKLTQSAPVAFLGWLAQLDQIEYNQYLGKLSQSKAQNKFFHTHRLEWKGEKFSLALSEHILYGDLDSTQRLDREVDNPKRDIEWVYVMPFVPYFFAEHYSGDQDNSAISLDGSYSHNGIHPYFELLIDDLKGPSGFFDDSWWGNKFAFSIGIQYELHKESNFIFLAEYTRIEPWVYTHSFGSGYSMTHFDQSIGSDLGPNSQEFYGELKTNPLNKLQVKSWASWVLKGYNDGSSANSIYFKEKGEGKEWIPSDQRNEYIETGLGFQYNISPYFSISSLVAHYFNQETWRSSSTLKFYF
jgi:hypothetical protein